MVCETRISSDRASDQSNKTTSDGSDEDDDTVSVATSSSASASADDEENHNNQLVLTDTLNKEPASFGNIAVSNSTDVHFGNKTYYQGPVTIKQFLYANPHSSVSENSQDSDVNKVYLTNGAGVPVPDSLGNDNPGFDPETDGTIKSEPIKNGYDIKNVCVDNTETSSEVRKGTQWLQNFSRQHVILVSSLIAVFAVSLVTLLAVLLTRHQHPTNTVNQPPVYNPDSNEQDQIVPAGLNTNYTLPPKLKIIERISWVAQPAVKKANRLVTPVPYVILMHTATEGCYVHPKCVLHVRSIQQFHVESRGWWDIGYNFLIGEDGFAYEGRGWESEGAHTYGYNSRSIGIAFIGTFNNTLPDEKALTAARQLIAKGVELNYIGKDYKLFAARQLQSTQSPGQKLFDLIKTWPHWAEQP